MCGFCPVLAHCLATTSNKDITPCNSNTMAKIRCKNPVSMEIMEKPYADTNSKMLTHGETDSFEAERVVLLTVADGFKTRSIFLKSPHINYLLL